MLRIVPNVSFLALLSSFELSAHHGSLRPSNFKVLPVLGLAQRSLTLLPIPFKGSLTKVEPVP